MSAQLRLSMLAALLTIIELAAIRRASAAPAGSPGTTPEGAAVTSSIAPRDRREPPGSAAGAGQGVEGLRPYDAPLVDPHEAHAPPLPPEYLTLHEGWLHLAYHPSARERARALAAQASAIRAEITRELGDGVLSSVEVRIAAVPAEMARLAPTELPGYATAVAFSKLRLVVMSLTSPLSLEPPDLADVLRHELAHVALDEALDGRRVPRWFHEGYAVHVAGDYGWLRAQTLCLASLRGRLLDLAELEAHFPAEAPQTSVAYAQGADFLRFLTQSKVSERFTALIQGVRATGDWERALATVYGASPAELELAWRKDIARRYSFAPVLLGSTLLWVLVAVFVALRRRHRARERRPLLVRHVRRPTPRDGDTRGRLGSLPPVAATRIIVAQRAREGSGFGEPISLDADVPKVEHEGQWHTLH